MTGWFRRHACAHFVDAFVIETVVVIDSSSRKTVQRRITCSDCGKTIVSADDFDAVGRIIELAGKDNTWLI